MLKKKIWTNFQRIIKHFTQKIVSMLSKILVWDPGSGKNLFRIPDPGVIKAPDPGYGSATLEFRYSMVVSHLASSGRTSSLSGREAKGVFSLVVITSSPESVVTSGVSAPPGDEPVEEEGRPAEGGEDGRPESTLCTSRLSACRGRKTIINCSS
jgi:hypothetical protein